MMDLRISGKTAAVAGASTGLGFATARALAAEGVRVAICSRNPEKLEQAARSLGGDALPIAADLSRPEEGTRFVEEAIAGPGQVDILIPNAGGPPPGLASTSDLDAYQYALDLNLKSTIAMCQASLPGMRKRGWGRIVAITSSGARSPIGFLAASSTARGGVSSFLKVLATEVAPDGVTVNSVQPGIHATDRIKGLGGDASEMGKSIPVGRIGDPDDFGQAAAFLCSEAAGFITGTSVLIDGGAFTGLG
jgi:3-oxoacyl-[acyl-carrier protein] reductase